MPRHYPYERHRWSVAWHHANHSSVTFWVVYSFLSPKHVISNMPGTALYFTTLSEIRHVMDATRATWQPWLRRETNAKEQAKWENLFAGVTARGSVGFIMMPITVLKVRYEVSTSRAFIRLV